MSSTDGLKTEKPVPVGICTSPERIVISLVTR